MHVDAQSIIQGHAGGRTAASYGDGSKPQKERNIEDPSLSTVYVLTVKLASLAVT
ncbi:MAG: hypothetical protein JWP84_766 [Tardiphaga sp.]|nr:hypothetical protein [Tardiphaga sp.]